MGKREQALAVSEELAQTIDESPDPVRIGDLVVDGKTGEILEWPEGISQDRFDWITNQARQAEDNMKGWERALILYKLTLGQLLTESGKKSLPTPYGTPRWGQRDNTQAPVERVPEIADKHELGTEALLFIYGCASRLSVPRLRELKRMYPKLAPAIDDLIEPGMSNPWVQIDKPRQVAPEIERVKP